MCVCNYSSRIVVKEREFEIDQQGKTMVFAWGMREQPRRELCEAPAYRPDAGSRSIAATLELKASAKSYSVSDVYRRPEKEEIRGWTRDAPCETWEARPSRLSGGPIVTKFVRDETRAAERASSSPFVVVAAPSRSKIFWIKIREFETERSKKSLDKNRNSCAIRLFFSRAI